jgi:aminoglycoside phosphotransferase (APT) family kinase protein
VKWQEVYAAACARRDAAAGYYNDNVRVDLPEGPVNVRIPIQGAETMDLRPWSEAEVLAAIARYVPHAPRLLYVSASPPFQVQEFITGEVLYKLAPRGTPVPSHVLGDVVALFLQLTRVPRDELPAVPKGWPADGDTAGFAHQLSALTGRVYDEFRDAYAPLYEQFGVPDNPLKPILSSWNTLTERPSVCVHADVHRKNIIIRDGVSVFLDWELALRGDPVYELAVHVHKMGYLPDEEDTVLTRWCEAMPPEHTAGWHQDLDTYLAHEQVKSAIVDIVRYAQAFSQRRFRDPEDELISKLATKVNNARRRWGNPDDIETAAVDQALRRWAATHRDIRRQT